MGKRSYTFRNAEGQLICVFRLESFSVSAGLYSVGFYEANTAKLIGKTQRSFETAAEAQMFLDRLASKNKWKANDF